VVVLATLIVASACTRTAVIPRAAGISATVAAIPAPVLPSARPSATAKPAETTGGIRTNSAGAILPNPRRTPGAINPAVTQSSIGRTICVTGWTATIRPPSSYTTALKQHQLATGYAYRGDTNTSSYEEDHLISLELGGSPTAEGNLWPEPYTAIDGARTKDTIENKLHRLVCARAISLATAQHAIAGNWYTAYLTYLGTPTPRTTTTTHSPAPAHSTTPNPGAGATALCNDATYSYAAHHQGACSHHGGVKVFYH
jgi:hypothetical protein